MNTDFLKLKAFRYS